MRLLPFNPMTYAGVAAYPFMRGLYSNAGRSVLNPMIAGASALGNGVGALTPIAAQIAARRMTGLQMPPQQSLSCAHASSFWMQNDGWPHTPPRSRLGQGDAHLPRLA